MLQGTQLKVLTGRHVGSIVSTMQTTCVAVLASFPGFIAFRRLNAKKPGNEAIAVLQSYRLQALQPKDPEAQEIVSSNIRHNHTQTVRGQPPVCLESPLVGCNNCSTNQINPPVYQPPNSTPTISSCTLCTHEPDIVTALSVELGSVSPATCGRYGHTIFGPSPEL